MRNSSPTHCRANFFPRRLLKQTLSVLAVILLPALLRAETTSYSGASLVPGTTSSTTPLSISSALTISASGTYYLAQDIVSSQTSGNAINITASNVTLDLNGHKVTGTGGNTMLANGIHSGDVANITVRNGTIGGFYRGVYLNSTVTGTNFSSYLSYGHLLENLNLSKNWAVGAYVAGVGCRIYHCRAVMTGGTNTGPGATYYSFFILGYSLSVEDCDVMRSLDTTYPSCGIAVSTGTNSFVVNNRFSGITYGIQSVSNGTFSYRDNLTSGVTTPYPPANSPNATNAGNNN